MLDTHTKKKKKNSTFQPFPSSSSLSGTCPALEHRGELVDAPAGAAGPTQAAALIIAYARGVTTPTATATAESGAPAPASSSSAFPFDLDAKLPKPHAAEAAAWRALAAAALEPASAFAAWCNDAGAYEEFTRKEYGAGLPFPLSALIPRSTKRAVSARFFSPSSASASAGPAAVRERVLSDAVAAHAAVAAKLSSSSASAGSSPGGPFFFGKTPSSLDASLFAHLSFHAFAPVSPPELRESIRCRPEIGRYLVAVAEAAGIGMEEGGLLPPPYLAGSGWEAAAADAARAARAASPGDFLGGRPGAAVLYPPGGRRGGTSASSSGGKKEGGEEGGGCSWSWWPFGKKSSSTSGSGGAASKRDLSHRRGNALWVASVTALVLGYVALSGQYFTIEWEDLDYEGGGGGEGGESSEGGGGGDGVFVE